MSVNHETNKEQALYERACNVLPGGVSRNIIYRKPHPHYVARAQGCYVEDLNGVKRIDFVNNIASLIHGHAHPAIVEAVYAQMQKGTAMAIGTEAEIRHAEHFISRVPGFEKIRFVNSGTEAVMAMIRTARAFTGKYKIAKAEGAYHGSYDFAEVSQSAGPSNWGELDSPNSVAHTLNTPPSVLNDVVVFPYNDVERTIAILDRYAGEIACVLIDPVPQRIGMMRATPEFVEAVYQWTRKNNALMAFDEVVCFRVDYEGAQAAYSVKPDLTSLGKIIGGGFPVGALAGKTEIMEVMNPSHSPLPFPLSGTFSANPISMTAGRVAMELFNRDAVNQVNDLAAVAKKQLKEAANEAGIPLCITGDGSMFKMHFKEQPPRHYRENVDNDMMKKAVSTFLEFMYDEGVILVYSNGCFMNTVMGQTEVDKLSEAALKGFRHIRPLLNV